MGGVSRLLRSLAGMGCGLKGEGKGRLGDMTENLPVRQENYREKAK
ncbi:hypothetical protein [Thermincola ferriacetica]|nr:hypothetical protein [Thermincola ferriacetica]